MSRKLKDVMVDIETMGTGLTPAIKSIAAVEFDMNTGEIGESFKIGITLSSNEQYGLNCEANTVEWWLRQSKEAKLSLLGMKEYDLKSALFQFSKWFRNLDGVKTIWSKGPNFDLRVLFTAYSKTGLRVPWHYTNERCVRTIMSLHPKCTELADPPEVSHDPEQDCHYQIRCCVISMNYHRSGGTLKLYERKSLLGLIRDWWHNSKNYSDL